MSFVREHKNIGAATLFGAFMLVQLVILRLGNQAGRGYLPEAQQERVYLYIQVVVILGFLSHALMHRLLHRPMAYRVVTAAALSLCLVGAGIMLFAGADSAFYLAVGGITVYLLGLIGGAVYLRLAAMIASGARAGVCIGLGYAAAITLQFCLQLQWTVLPALAVLFLLAFAGIAFVLLSGDLPLPDRTPREDRRAARMRPLLCAGITFALLVFTSYYNSYIHHLQIASGYTDYNVYSWPRLLMIPGILLFGLLGEIRGGRLLPVCTLCMVAIALLNAVLIGRETYLLNMCLYYLAIIAVIAYYHLTFLRLACDTRRPAVWAVMGRILDSVLVILSFILGFAQMSTVAVLVIDIAALAAVIILMAVNGDFNLSAAPEPPAEVEPVPPADNLQAIRSAYGLTPSELKVLRELILTDDKQDVIALRLHISVSTLRHHVTAIYKKTGVQTRTALCKLSPPEAR